MAKRGSDQVGFLLVDGYDVLGVTTQIEDNLEAVIEDTHALGDKWVKRECVGLKQAELTQEGFYDDDADSINDALCKQTGAVRLLCYGLDGNVIGQHFVGYSGALQANYTRIASRGTLHRANAKYQGAGDIDEGLIIHPHVSRSTGGDTKDYAVDNGESSPDGGVAYLQVGCQAGTATVKIEHSEDGEDWADLVTFGEITEVPAAMRKVVTGTVERYLAVTWTGKAKFFVGFKRN